MDNILYSSKFIAKISTSILAGNAIRCSLIDHPARLECDTNAAIAHWRRMFKIALPTEGGLAVLSFSSILYAYYLEKNNFWLKAGLIVMSILPFSYFAIMPTNNALLDLSKSMEMIRTRKLLVKWGEINTIRSLMAFLALVLINMK
jgi:uncharacterized membrane protein